MARTKQQNKKRDADKYFSKVKYQRSFWSDYDYTVLDHIPYVTRKGKGNNLTWNDVIIMLDTETSKTDEKIQLANGNYVNRNIIVMFTISIRCCNRNIVTLWGKKPSDCIRCMQKIINRLDGNITPFYAHNLPYDWTFLRKFMFRQWGTPTKQLNVKSHYPIYIEFDNGIILRDSLILAQRSLEKWALDMDVEHKKAVGFWDYNKHRDQFYTYSDYELKYAEFDTLAGVECLQKLKDMLHKQIYAMPWTVTGIPREECRKRGKGNGARDTFLKLCPQTLDLYLLLERVYHGGYTHGNRYYIDKRID